MQWQTNHWQECSKAIVKANNQLGAMAMQYQAVTQKQGAAAWWVAAAATQATATRSVAATAR